MKMKDIQKKTDADLHKMLREKRTALQAFRFGSSGSKKRNTKEGALLKKDIAQILTELTKRHHEEEVAA